MPVVGLIAADSPEAKGHKGQAAQQLEPAGRQQFAGEVAQQHGKGVDQQSRHEHPGQDHPGLETGGQGEGHQLGLVSHFSYENQE